MLYTCSFVLWANSQKNLMVEVKCCRGLQCSGVLCSFSQLAHASGSDKYRVVIRKYSLAINEPIETVSFSAPIITRLLVKYVGTGT